MKTKRKTFDCVEMKNRIQRGLRREYLSRRREFDSYADFITATAAEMQEVRAYWAGVATSRGGK